MMPLQVERTTQTSGISLKKKIIFSLISWVFLMFVLACIGEVFLRVAPMGKFQSSPFRQYDPNIGIALVPNKTIHHNKGCFQGLVETNSFGMRDHQRTLDKPPGVFRIAMLGDSVNRRGSRPAGRSRQHPAGENSSGKGLQRGSSELRS